jgi:pimeloyl-ACP methyl ester carboxylesterase
MKLIFIHGAGCSKEVWEYQLRHFPDAEALDLPGRSGSKLRSSAGGYAAWLSDYVRLMRYREIVLVGHSFGGAACQMFAVKNPPELKGLVLIGTGARIRVHPDIFAHVRRMVENPAEWAEYVADQFAWAKEADRERIIQARINVTARVMLKDLEACNRFELMDQVSGIKVPTLVICGSKDEATPVKYTDYLADRIRGAEKLVVKGAGHYVFGEKPEAVNKTIDDFLTRLV